VRRLLGDNLFTVLSAAGLLAGLTARYGAGSVPISEALWLAVIVGVGLPLTLRTAREVAGGRLHADVIAALAIVASLLMREYLAGVLIVVMQTSGEALERYAFRRASGALELLLAHAPRVAHRLEEGRLVDVNAAEVQAGDRLVVKPGELVPVDARVLAGESGVDQSMLTGEPLIVEVGPGSEILSGSVNVQGALEVTALRPAAESQYERIVALVREAQADKPPIQRLADRAAIVFTPLTLVMCALAWLVTGDPASVLSVLVVATPCPLILAVPVAVFAAINRAAAHHAIVKHGAAIEQVGSARAVIFDKTGTLTHGTPDVIGVTPLDGHDPAEVLRLAAAVEQLSSHQLGRALARYGERRYGPLPVPSDFQETVGRGVCGVVEGRRAQVGSRAIVAEGSRAAVDAALAAQATPGTIAVVVLVEGRPAGIVTFADRLRPGVPAMMAALRCAGVRTTVMLTGDASPTARAIAAAAGIDDARAGLLPQDKVAAVKELTARHGSTVMVGDGTNDAPALATATVGVAMGARGTGISAEAADVVLLRDDVTDLVAVMRAGRRMRRIAFQSVGLGIGLSLALMVFAVLGFIRPTVGALLQEAIDVTVVLNALRARGGD
jgi:heavy metal translocating P-type ATPase